MTYQIIESLVEKFSCDFVLADPSEPASLTCLFPVLKQMHGKCRRLSLDVQAKEILKAKKIIKAVLDSPDDADENMTALGELISELSSSLILLNQTDPSNDNKDNRDDRSAGLEPADPGDFSDLQENLEKFDYLIAGFCGVKFRI